MFYIESKIQYSVKLSSLKLILINKKTDIKGQIFKI